MRKHNGLFPASHAFTLIELSVVLVIIGLVVGGVLVGRDMIRQSEIRSALSDLEKYGTATNTFYGKYSALPGDMLNATSYFGTDSNGCPSGGGSTGTCNGDGNGQIGAFIFNRAPNAGTISPAETFRYWQQLSLAGLVAGQFTGINGPLGYRQSVPGSNEPVSRISSNAGYMIYYLYGPGPAQAGDDRFPIDAGGHWWWVGSVPDPSGAQYESSGGVMTPAEAQRLDQKFDDGLPGTGTIRSIYGIKTNCATTIDPTNAQYLLSNAAPGCSLNIKAPF